MSPCPNVYIMHNFVLGGQMVINKRHTSERSIIWWVQCTWCHKRCLLSKKKWLGLNQALTSCSLTVSLPYRCIAWSPSMMQYETGGKQNTTTFSPMIIDKKISTAMAEKCGKSGIAPRHLKLACQWDGRGVFSLFREFDRNSKPRVTARKDIIESICQ